MSHGKNDFSEKKVIKLSHLLIWLDTLTDDFNAYCEKDEVPTFIKVVESLRDSYLKYKKGKRKIICGSPTSIQLEWLNDNPHIPPRQWISTIEISIDPDQLRSMQLEKEVLTISVNIDDIKNMIADLNAYCRRRTHAFSIFSVPKRISNRRRSSTEFHFWYNLEGID